VTDVEITAGMTVSPNERFEFVIDATAPENQGSYVIQFQMNGPDGDFGEVTMINIDVDACGNGTLEAVDGEQCDDGNLVNQDGCDDGCLLEPIERDLATHPADYVFRPDQTVAQLQNVAIGDVIGDRRVNVVLGDAGNVVVGMGTNINRAGRVHVVDLDSITTDTATVPRDAMATIVGGGSTDNLGGGTNNSMYVADVTGEGVADLILSAAAADGPLDMRPDCGEVFVIAGGNALAMAGQLEVGAPLLNPQIRARIIGGAAGHGLRAIAVGDVNGDGVADIAVGAPGADVNGEDSGAVVIIRGGPTLRGTIDLTGRVPPPNAIAVILGSSAEDRLGSHPGAIGNIGGSDDVDFVIGSPRHSPGGRSRAGAVWASFGPLTGSHDLSANGYSVRWLGQFDNEQTGTAIAIGQVIGDESADVVISGVQVRNGGSQVGAVDIWRGPITPGDYDLSMGAGADVVILGRDPNDRFGAALSLGDVNQDGYEDIAVASSAGDGPIDDRDRAGEVAVILGGEMPPDTLDLAVEDPPYLLYAPGGLDSMGTSPWSVYLGDLDDNGSADLCAGSLRNDGGRVDCVIIPW